MPLLTIEKAKFVSLGFAATYVLAFIAFVYVTINSKPPESLSLLAYSSAFGFLFAVTAAGYYFLTKGKYEYSKWLLGIAGLFSFPIGIALIFCALTAHDEETKSAIKTG